jgi:amidase
MANSMDGQNSILSVVGPLATSASSLKLATKALLDQKPWLHDPMVHEIPWRGDSEVQSEGEKLCFAVMASDGIVNPMPPVRRAVDTVVKALQEQGHKVVEWKPPSHKPILDAALQTWTFDAGTDVKSAFALSGEPMAPQVSFYNGVDKESTASEIAALNVRLRDLKKEYLDYWTATEKETGTGRPVDAVICPLAPFPAARRERFRYLGYSVWVNALDYTSVVVPVTEVDKNVDVVEKSYTPIDESDKEVQDDCKCTLPDPIL